ncbi:hypothetical protein XENTR_v10010035 [Xenopus tropicalis]|nr:hypothetical protein XENTR_v10010035 [Xenopus tropicalis]
MSLLPWGGGMVAIFRMHSHIPGKSVNPVPIPAFCKSIFIRYTILSHHTACPFTSPKPLAGPRLKFTQKRKLCT